MTHGIFRGVVHDGMVVLEAQTPLADGTEVVVTVVVGARGSPASVLAAVEESPRVPAEWVDELEQLIAQGQRIPASPKTPLFSA